MASEGARKFIRDAVQRNQLTGLEAFILEIVESAQFGAGTWPFWRVAAS